MPDAGVDAEDDDPVAAAEAAAAAAAAAADPADSAKVGMADGLEGSEGLAMATFTAS